MAVRYSCDRCGGTLVNEESAVALNVIRDVEDLHQPGGTVAEVWLLCLSCEALVEQFLELRPAPRSAESLEEMAPTHGLETAILRSFLADELRAFLDKQFITDGNIGAIRARLSMPWETLWNSVVRDETAKREKSLDWRPPTPA